VAVIHNYPIINELNGPADPYADRPNQIVYVGSMTAVRGLREVVQAVALLPESMEVSLELGGTFHPPDFQNDLERLPGWRRTVYHGWVDRARVSEMLGRARLGIVTLHPTEKYLSAYPTKLFEYMAAGLPVVCSDFPKLRPFVLGPRCGLLVDPLDPRAIAGAIRWLLEHPEEARAMGRRGREAVLDRFNWSPEGERLVAFYSNLTLKD
jgi:glycosyltransferase involved in cell wall biosynthesis